MPKKDSFSFIIKNANNGTNMEDDLAIGYVSDISPFEYDFPRKYKYIAVKKPLNTIINHPIRGMLVLIIK